ncbi:hypothetical protein [Thermococcus nautili]|uniref:Uncharacterized protein n=1 Tax=Thermococcus nautili TaxID=195522 RepID=W8NSL1_9EURY|nr:hypothetical protein [Thermococcus nautili]AHL22107.1 hypothetical protein BD01_0482 [Thermococcus nautili]
MKRVLIAILLVFVVLSAGCMGGTNTPTTESQSATSSSIGNQGESPTTSSTATPEESVKAEPWAYQSLNLEPTEELGYSLHTGSLSGTNAEVEVIVIDKPADFAKTSANWEASPDEVSANNVVFQVGKNVYYFELRGNGVYTEAGRVVGDLFDFIRLDDDKYIGWENGVVRVYLRSLNKYREKKGVLAYATTVIGGKLAIVTSFEDNLTVTTFEGGNAESEDYTFDCTILSMHPAFGDGTIAGFYMGTTCGFYYVDPDLNVHDSGLGDDSWQIVSNDHDEVGSVVLYSSDSNSVVTAYYDWDDDAVYVSEPLKVEKRPSSASLSWFYLALAYGNKLYLYELGEDSAYHYVGTITFPDLVLDVKLVQPDDNTLEIGVAWSRGFAHIVVPVSELKGEHTFSVGKELSESTGTETAGETGTSTSAPGELNLEGVLESFTFEEVNFGDLKGVRIHLLKSPDYRNVHDWMGWASYAAAGLPDVYFSFGNYLVRVRGGEIKNLYYSGEDINKYSLSAVYVLPATPKDISINIYDSDEPFFAGTDGKLYLIYDNELKSEDTPKGKIRYYETTGYVSWNIDADGVTALARKGNYYYTAWKGKTLYVITYTSDQLYNARHDGLPAVTPKSITLPEDIVAVYPMKYGEGLLIRTETGLYLYDVAGYYKYGAGKLYTLLTNVPGRFAYQHYTEDAVIYNGNRFTWIELTGKYDSNDIYVPVARVYPATVTVPGAKTFSIMFNTYDTQLAVGFDGRIALYNVTTGYYYDENDNRVYYLNLTLDQSFSVPFTPDYVYGEDECYCHVSFHANYYYAWAGNDFYVLLGPNHRRW